MSETTHHHHDSHQHHSHHHHSHGKKDTASIFKYKSLAAIERKKKIRHWLFISLCVIAVVMFLIVVYLYI